MRIWDRGCALGFLGNIYSKWLMYLLSENLLSEKPIGPNMIKTYFLGPFLEFYWAIERVEN